MRDRISPFAIAWDFPWRRGLPRLCPRRKRGKPPSLPAAFSGRNGFSDSRESSRRRRPIPRSQSQVPSCPHHAALTIKQPALSLRPLREKASYASAGGRFKEWNPGFVKRFWEEDSEGKFDISVGKHLGGESLDGSGLAPGIQRQTSLAAGLLQKNFPVPTMFDGNLGQQQAAASAQRDDQTVAPDFHCRGMNREQAGENAQRDLQIESLFLRNRQETGIFESGGAGRFGHGTIQRRDGHGIAGASPKGAAA